MMGTKYLLTRGRRFATNTISVFSFFQFGSISVFDFCVDRQFIWGKNEISEKEKAFMISTYLNT